jgi:RNA polymerase sporulation-specific sigma factor
MENVFEKLVAKAREKDKDAAGEIIERLKPLIRANVKRGWIGLDKEDLYQELCLVALECVNTFDPAKGVPFLAYVKRAMQYRVWNLRKAQKWEVSLDAEDEQGNCIGDMLSDPNGNVDAAVVMRCEAERLKKALETLSLKQRQVILAHYFRGEKLKQIAARLKKHQKGVMSLKKRGLSALRDKFL